MTKPNKDLEQIKKKLNELEGQFSMLSHKTFSYLAALTSLLDSKGVASSEEIVKSIEENKKLFSRAQNEAEFWKLSEQLKKKKKDK